MNTKSNAVRFLERLRGGPLTFGRMVQSLRKADEISQAELARKLGMSRAHLCDIEKGRRQVSIMLVAAIARAMGYAVDQFVSVALEDELRKAGLKLRVELKAA